MKWLFSERIKPMLRRNSLEKIAKCVKAGEVYIDHRHVVDGWTEIADEPIGPTTLGVLMGLALLDDWWRTKDDVTRKTGVTFSMPILSIEDNWLLMRGNRSNLTPPCVCICAVKDAPLPTPREFPAFDKQIVVDRIPRIGDLVGKPYAILRSEREPGEEGCYSVVRGDDLVDHFPGFLASQERAEEQALAKTATPIVPAGTQQS